METPTCRAHDRKTGQQCTAPPLGNTGLCPKHGGRAVEKSIAINTKHGFFATILPHALNQLVDAAHDGPFAKRLDEEIALLRAFFARFLSTFQDSQPITATDLEMVGRHAERISRLLARQSRIQAEDRDAVSGDALKAWTEETQEVMLDVLDEFLPDAETYSAAFKRVSELMVERGLLLPQTQEQADQTSLVGSPFPSEERADREGGQGVRQQPEVIDEEHEEPDDSEQIPLAGSPSLATGEQIRDDGPVGALLAAPTPPSSYESLLLSLGIDPRDYPAPRRRCCAHDYNIMRRCEHPPMPGSYNCERHQNVPPAEEYVQSENQYM